VTEKKKNKSWGEMSGGERKAVLVGWAAIIVLAGWFFLPGEEEQSKPPKPAPMVDEPARAPASTYQAASAEALAAAKQYLEELDQAMIDSIAVLKAGELQGQHDQSKYFGAQVDKGRALFGATIFEPLGRCFAAGNFARAWWQAQLSAARNGGVESVLESIKDALSEYQMNSAECIKDADPLASAETATELNAHLQKKFDGGRECLTTFDVDPETKQVVAKPKPEHCKG
jgi:hypothetical protein